MSKAIHSVVKIKEGYIDVHQNFSTRLKAERRFKELVKTMDVGIPTSELKECLKNDLYADDLKEESVQIICNAII